MKWFCNVLSWHFACLALALLVLGSTVLTAKVAADSPPLTTAQDPPPPPPDPPPNMVCSCDDPGYCPYCPCCQDAPPFLCDQGSGCSGVCGC